MGVDGHTEGLGPRGVRFGLAGRTDEGTLRTEDPGEHLPTDRGAHLARVVQLHDLPARFLGVPIANAAPQDLPDQGLRSPVEGDVEEAGPGDLDAYDPLGLGDERPQDLGDMTWRTPGGPGQLQGDIRGVVTASPGPRRHHHGPRGHGHAELTGVHGAAHGAQDGTGELDGCHGDKRMGGGGG